MIVRSCRGSGVGPREERKIGLLPKVMYDLDDFLHADFSAAIHAQRFDACLLSALGTEMRVASVIGFNFAIGLPVKGKRHQDRNFRKGCQELSRRLDDQERGEMGISLKQQRI